MLSYAGLMLEALSLGLVMVILGFALPLPVQVLLFVCAVALMIPGIYAMATGAPFVPTRKDLLKRMIAAAHIQPGDKVYDLGCGDGRIVFAAAALGANAVGYELSVPTWLLAKIRSLFHPGSSIQLKNFWKQDYRDADVIFCYLLQDTMQIFKEAIWPRLKPGTRVISHAFTMDGITAVSNEKYVIVYVKK